MKLLPLSSWLDLMILSEYSDILEHSIWRERGGRETHTDDRVMALFT